MLFWIAIANSCIKEDASLDTILAPFIFPSLAKIFINPSIQLSQCDFPNAEIGITDYWYSISVSFEVETSPTQAISGVPYITEGTIFLSNGRFNVNSFA